VAYSYEGFSLEVADLSLASQAFVRSSRTAVLYEVKTSNVLPLRALSYGIKFL
jgi:hypothetical protein